MASLLETLIVDAIIASSSAEQNLALADAMFLSRMQADYGGYFITLASEKELRSVGMTQEEVEELLRIRRGDPRPNIPTQVSAAKVPDEAEDKKKRVRRERAPKSGGLKTEAIIGLHAEMKRDLRETLKHQGSY